jgi:hypothetical protein
VDEIINRLDAGPTGPTHEPESGEQPTSN